MVVIGEENNKCCPDTNVSDEEETCEKFFERCPSQNEQPKSFCSRLLNYPKAVYFCLGCEFSERFSFYGMRSIMMLYFIMDKRLLPSQAKLWYHAFICLAYFTPLLGSILADGFFGKFKVILFLSLIYCLGHGLITVAALPALSYLISSLFDFAGFFVIAVASGGMRPCVAAFAGDQFGRNMVEQRRQFFSFFYFAINLGGLISIFVVPGLRFHIHCFGQLSCFPLAFFVPACFIVASTVLFIAGKKYYLQVPPTKNIIGEVCGCIYFALKERFRNGKTLSKGHWLDYGSKKYPKQLVADIKVLISIIVLYLPIIVFWALYDQMGSTWILQANMMNGRLGRMTLLPDQMTVINAGLILILVPIFEGIIYPVCNKLNIMKTSLRRMGWGGIITASTFVAAGFLQLGINSKETSLPSSFHSRFMFYNAFNETVKLNNDVTVYHVTPDQILKADLSNPFITMNNGRIIELNQKMGTFVFLSPGMNVLNMSYTHDKTESGQTRLYILNDVQTTGDLAINVLFEDGSTKAFINLNETSAQSYVDLEPGFFGSNELHILVEPRYNETIKVTNFYLGKPSSKLPLEAGSAFVLVVLNSGIYLIQLVSGNTVSILWQFPQYFLITVAEILFSITGLEFSYSQAPDSMKTVLQAVWLLSGAFGNLLAAFISGSNVVTNPAWEFFLYALLMYMVMVIFIILAKRYKYVDCNYEINLCVIEEQNKLKNGDL